MKKTVCLLACLCCLLVLIGCEQAPGGETLPPNIETTTPTQTTTVPSESTVPPETTAPPETAAPPESTVPEETTAALVTKDIPLLRITDRMYEVDSEIEGTVIRVPDVDPSGLVSATHIRFFTELSNEAPYKDGVFLVCTDEREGKSASHYQGYIVEDGQLRALENRTLSKILSVEGREIPVDMQYVIYQDQVIVTYMPNSSFITILDDSRGASDCLVRLEYWNRETNSDYFTCVAFMDMETGTVKNSFSKFENKELDFVAMNKEGGVIMQRRDNGQYWLVTLSTGFCVQNYRYEPKEYALTYKERYVDGKSYLEVTDPLDGETVLLKTPEGWDLSNMIWDLSPDGRKIRAWNFNLLIYDGDRKMWIEISRELPNGMKMEIRRWTEDNEIVFLSKDLRNVTIYRFAPEK